MQDWWTDERVSAVVTDKFVLSQLDQRAASRINDVVFEDLSEDTYLDWILERAKRLFLVLTDTGCASHIIHLIDLSYEDSSLPIAERDVPGLRLPPRATNPDISRQFFRNQFKYLIRVIREGEHIRYSRSASVPLHVVDQRVPNGYPGAQDRVRLPPPYTTTLLRVREPLSSKRSEATILSEIEALRMARHDHVASVFASYCQDDSMYLLTQPATQYTLKSFLSDLPKPFKALEKPERQMKLSRWPHCLANALAWIHSNHISHGAISPSRILVDDGFNIILGHFKAVRSASQTSSSKDIEYYQYAAPELCQRRLIVQTSEAYTRPALDTLSEYAELRESLNSAARVLSHSTKSPTLSNGRPDSFIDSPINATTPLAYPDGHSFSSCSSEDGSITSPSRRGHHPMDFRHQIMPEARAAVVQGLRASSKLDPLAADVFSLAAVSMDIMSVLVGESPSAFAKHRASGSRTTAPSSRGAAVIDSSVHANLHQVASWAGRLAKEALKKSKKGNALFEAVGPNLNALLQCMDRGPGKRLRAYMLSLTLEANLHEYAGVTEMHCALQGPTPVEVA